MLAVAHGREPYALGGRADHSSSRPSSQIRRPMKDPSVRLCLSVDSAEQRRNGGHAIGSVWVGRDAQDDVILVPAHGTVTI